MVNNEMTDYSTRYANWNKFYDDLEGEIKNIRIIGNELLFDIEDRNLSLNKYFSLIINLFSTHKSYVLKADDIYKKLEKIEKMLFSDEFLYAIKNRPQNTKKLKIQIIKDLRNIFSVMCENFSLMGLRPKIDKTNIEKYSDKLEGEAKKEMQTLESVGLI